jgi:hypothetical protein
MTILPREQVIQRHPRAAVSAPGVLLWSSQTDLAICDVEVTDEVTDGEVELAQNVAPYMEWHVVGETPGFGYDAFGVEPFGEPTTGGEEKPGIYQFGALGEGPLGSGPLGGVELEWYVEHGPSYWSEGNGEDGVYP